MSEHRIIDGIDYGPLVGLIGTWKGDQGRDTSPEPDGDEYNPYYETIAFSAAGDVTNAEEQTLSIVRYHQQVSRKSNDELFHEQVGFWLWDPTDNTIIETFTIPRGLALVAGGVAAPAAAGDEVVLSVSAAADDPDWGISQFLFLRKRARTERFEHRVSVQGDRMNYHQTTFLDIYGRKFDHTDRNELTRLAT